MEGIVSGIIYGTSRELQGCGAGSMRSGSRKRRNLVGGDDLESRDSEEIAYAECTKSPCHRLHRLPFLYTIRVGRPPCRVLKYVHLLGGRCSFLRCRSRLPGRVRRDWMFSFFTLTTTSDMTATAMSRRGGPVRPLGRVLVTLIFPNYIQFRERRNSKTMLSV